MCDRCVNLLANQPSGHIDLLKKYRERLRTLAKEMAEDFNNEIFTINKDSFVAETPEGQKILDATHESHALMVALALGTGFVCHAENHIGIYAQEIDQLFHHGAHLGWAYSHLENIPKNNVN
jgi:hypothetical protein